MPSFHEQRLGIILCLFSLFSFLFLPFLFHGLFLFFLVSSFFVFLSYTSIFTFSFASFSSFSLPSLFYYSCFPFRLTSFRSLSVFLLSRFSSLSSLILPFAISPLSLLVNHFYSLFRFSSLLGLLFLVLPFPLFIFSFFPFPILSLSRTLIHSLSPSFILSQYLFSLHFFLSLPFPKKCDNSLNRRNGVKIRD